MLQRLLKRISTHLYIHRRGLTGQDIERLQNMDLHQVEDYRTYVDYYNIVR